MKRFILAAVTVLAALVLGSSVCNAAAKPKAELNQATFLTSLHCKACAQKIQENIAFEKGVKDLKVDVDTKIVKVTYDPAKTDAAKLGAAIKKLGYTAECKEDKKL